MGVTWISYMKEQLEIKNEVLQKWIRVFQTRTLVQLKIEHKREMSYKMNLLLFFLYVYVTEYSVIYKRQKKGE